MLDPTLLMTAEQWEYDLPVINVYGVLGRYYSATGPREFVYLVDHADYVLTSSFHGTAFSVNFGKRFISFKVGLRFSRIRTLLANLGLMDRVFVPDRDILSAPIDYEAVNEKLQALRERSMRYLASCLA